MLEGVVNILVQISRSYAKTPIFSFEYFRTAFSDINYDVMTSETNELFSTSTYLWCYLTFTDLDTTRRLKIYLIILEETSYGYNCI